ncbi:MAG: hypothetical protein R2717_07775 [Schumannella sp.]
MVMLDSEFPTAIVTGQRLREAGAELRLVPAMGIATAGEREEPRGASTAHSRRRREAR